MDTALPSTHREHDVVATAAIELASVEMAFARPTEALGWLDRASAHLAEQWVPRWLLEYGEAASECGRTDVAEQALRRLEACASVTGDRWASAAVLRLRAALADQASDRVRWAALAAAAFTDAHALVDAGRALIIEARNSTSSPRCRHLLQQASALFRTAGAVAWEQRVRTELHPLPDPLHELTEGERLVASFVADGARNREIAAILHVSVRTVESHLERAYRKLGIRSRTELARLSLAG